MNCTRSAPGNFDASLRSWRSRISGVAGFAAVVVGITACGDAAPDVTETLTDACTEARQALADAPTPADTGSEAAFITASREATQSVVAVIEDLGEQVDDQALADMAWQLNNFPQLKDNDELLGVAHEATAAITRLDGFAEELSIQECGAPTWRPADWRAMADRLKEQQSDDAFRADLNRLCSETFPDPSRLSGDTLLLEALVGAGENRSEDVVGEVLSRLQTLSSRPAEARRFLREFSAGLPEMSPSDNLEDDYLALLSAFLHVDAVVPNVIPDDPSEDFRARVDPAFEELQRTWGELDITCSA